jgi:uncharacterized protein DUF6285
MRDLPTGPVLKALADDWEARELPSLPLDERSLAERMIRRCRAIARREAEFGEAALASMTEALNALYGAGDASAQLKRLATDIRAGRYDQPGPLREQVLGLLWMLTCQKLRESNPRFLAAHESE